MENRVGFGPRLGAYVIDFVIQALLAVALGGTVAGLFPEAYQQMLAKQLAGAEMDPAKIEQVRSFLEATVRWSLAVSVLGVIYGLIEGFTGWSPGKLILGLRIAGESGQRAPAGKLLLRYLLKFATSLVFLVGVLAVSTPIQLVGQLLSLALVVSCLFVLGKPRQTLHDRVVRTIVLRKSDLPA